MTPCINYLNTVGVGWGREFQKKRIVVIVLMKYILTILMFNYLINPLKKGSVCCNWQILTRSEKYRDRYMTAECYMSWAVAPHYCSPLRVAPLMPFLYLNRTISEGQDSVMKSFKIPPQHTNKNPQNCYTIFILAIKNPNTQISLLGRKPRAWSKLIFKSMGIQVIKKASFSTQLKRKEFWRT